MVMNKKPTPQDIKDAILLRALEDVPFDGWTLEGIELAANDLGYEDGTIRALFPAGVEDMLVHFSDYCDRLMHEKLKNQDLESMRVRDRIRAHILARLDVLETYKEALRLSLEYWKCPGKQGKAAKIIWKTSDSIWKASGDTSTDYNRITKRMLLSGILASTTLYWLHDQTHDYAKTKSFLDKRIENVMQFGKIIGTLKKRV
jgi:ubiquinone biosynthesis protein COQ9